MASKLVQMQARFQQKQMQEKEEKLLKIYETQQQKAFEKVGRSSAGSSSSNTSIGSTGGGKVRQMFEERRQKAGVDKSYPLEPLKTNRPDRKVHSTTTVKSVTNKTTSQLRNGKPVFHQKESSQKVYNNNYANGNYEEHTSVVETFDNVDNHNNLVDIMNNHNINDDDYDIDQLPKIGFNDAYKDKPPFMGKLANLGGKLPSQKFIENNPPKTGTVTEKPKNEPKVVAKKPTAKAAKAPPRSNSSVSSNNTESPRTSPTRAVENMTSKQQVSSPSPRAPTNNRPSSKQVAKSPVVRDDLSECRYCGRRFATDRLGVHEDICGKTGKKKRKPFDATKHRVQGTELEGYVMKMGKKSTNTKVTSKPSQSKAGNWRKTHEEFISTIRAAKEAQAYVAKGGKLSDLPPPPPSTNPDYVQCPHCGRRFNEAAAERHIPKCASFSFNKPKASAPQKARPGRR